MSYLFLTCITVRGDVHTPHPNPHLCGPAIRSSLSCLSCFWPILHSDSFPLLIIYAVQSMFYCACKPVSYGRIRMVHRPLNLAYCTALLSHYEYYQSGLCPWIFFCPVSLSQLALWSVRQKIISFWHCCFHAFVPEWSDLDLLVVSILIRYQAQILCNMKHYV